MRNLTTLRPAATTGGRAKQPVFTGVVLDEQPAVTAAGEAETQTEINIPIVTAAEDAPPAIPAAVAATGSPVDKMTEIPITAEAVTVTLAQDVSTPAAAAPVAADEPSLGDAFRIASGVTRRAFGRIARKMAPGAKTAGKVAAAGVGVGALAAAGAFVGPAIAAPAALAWAGTALALGARNMAKHG